MTLTIAVRILLRAQFDLSGVIHVALRTWTHYTQISRRKPLILSSTSLRVTLKNAKNIKSDGYKFFWGMFNHF